MRTGEDAKNDKNEKREGVGTVMPARVASTRNAACFIPKE